MSESEYDKKNISMNCSKSELLVSDQFDSGHKSNTRELQAENMPCEMSGIIQTSQVHDMISNGICEEGNIDKKCDENKIDRQQKSEYILENGAHTFSNGIINENCMDYKLNVTINDYEGKFEDINGKFEGANQKAKNSKNRNVILSDGNVMVNINKNLERTDHGSIEGSTEVNENEKNCENTEGSTEVNENEQHCKNNDENGQHNETQNENESDSFDDILKMGRCKNSKCDSDFTECVKAVKSGRYIRTFQIGSEGGTCVLSGMGVCLMIPAGALTSERDIFIGLSKNGHDFPGFSEGGHMYGPLIVCGPHGLEFEKPVYLMFQHSLVFTNTEDLVNLPTLHHSETGLLSDNTWQPYPGPVGLTRNMVMATINGFTKYLWRTIGDTPRSAYRILRTMVVLETEMLEESGGAVAVHIHVVDADSSEEQYVRSHAKGSVVATDTFLFSETPGKDLSLQLIPSDSFSLKNRNSAEIIEYEDILDNRVGLKNHVTFNLMRKGAGQGSHEPFECEVRVTQVDGYSTTTQVVRNIVMNDRSPKPERDSGLEEDFLLGAAFSGNLDIPVPLNPGDLKTALANCVNPPTVAEPGLSNTGNRHGFRRSSKLIGGASNCCSTIPVQNENSNAEVDANLDCEHLVHRVLKPGQVVSLSLPMSLRAKLEEEMDKETIRKLAQQLQVIEPKEWGVTALLHYFEAMHPDRNEALKELNLFFNTLGKTELATACKDCIK